MSVDIEFVCEDVNGISVSCSKQQWQYLVKHKEMEGQQGVVRAVIESPDFINQSASSSKKYTYYKQLVLPIVGNTYVRVVIARKIRALGKRGYVINAFSCDGEQQGEERIWTKS